MEPVRGGEPIRRGLTVVVLVALGISSTSCSGGDEPRGAAASDPATPTETRGVTEAAPTRPPPISTGASTLDPGAELSASDGIATVRVSPAAIGGGTVSATARPVPDEVLSELGDAVTALGPGVEVTIDGGELNGTATVSFELPADFDPTRFVPAVLWEAADGGWELLPSTWQPGDDNVVASTDHFSWGFGISIDWARFADSIVQPVAQLVTGRSGAPNPTCGDERGIRDQGTTIVSDSGDLIKWCYGAEAGRTVLKVTNNWRAGVQVRFPKSWTVVSYHGAGVSLQAIGDWLDSAARETDRTRARLVAPNETIVLEPVGIGPDAPGVVVIEPSTVSWMWSIAVLAAQAYVAVGGTIGRFGPEVAEGADFGVCFTEYYGSDADAIHGLSQPIPPESVYDTVVKASRFGIDCGERVIRDALSGRGGVLGRIASAFVAIVATAIGIAYGLVNAAFAGIRAIVDDFGALLAGPDVGGYGYDIVISTSPPASLVDRSFPYVVDWIDLDARRMAVRQVVNYFDYDWDNWSYGEQVVVRLAPTFYVDRVFGGNDDRVRDIAAFAAFENARLGNDDNREIVELGEEDGDETTIDFLHHFLDGDIGEGVDWDYCVDIGRGPDLYTGELQEVC